MDKMAILLEALSQKLGVAVDVLWGALVKQAGIERYSWMLFLFFTVLLTSMTLIVVYKMFHKKTIWELKQKEDRYYHYDWDEHTGEIAFSVISGVLSIIFLGVFMGNISNIIACFVNPEYIALRKILTALSGGGGD